MRGRKPPTGTPRHNVKPVHEWVEVENTPFTGPWPFRIPRGYQVSTRDGIMQRGFLDVTKRWWETIRTMPHCVLWEKSDWMFAISTVHVAEQAFLGVASAATELRSREKIMGTTVDARRDLRIRYVDELTGEEAEPEEEERTLAAVVDL